MTQMKSPVEEIVPESQEVSTGLSLTLSRHTSKLATPPTLSGKTQKHIEKRVSPSNLEKYVKPEEAIKLLAMEVSDLGTRISYYQYIERYREHFDPPKSEIRAAFVTHTHILRGSEIYVILDRCSSCLSFFHDLAVDLQLDPKPTADKLKKTFRSEFERHLRERHRIVHAHERPSLISRILNIPPNEMESVDACESYANIFAQLVSMANDRLGFISEDTNFNEALEKLNDMRLIAVDEECVKMWEIFLKGLTDLFDASKLMK